MAQCVLCCSVLSGRVSKRQLTSEASQHVVPVVRSMLLRTAQLQQSAIAVEVTNSSMCCRPCFRKMEKVLRLRKEVEKLESEVVATLMSSSCARGQHAVHHTLWPGMKLVMTCGH